MQGAEGGVQEPTDESLGEMEVAGRPYSQGRGVMAVHMDGEHALPPLDLALLQVMSSVAVCYTAAPLSAPVIWGPAAPPLHREGPVGECQVGPLAPGPCDPLLQELLLSRLSSHSRHDGAAGETCG